MVYTVSIPDNVDKEAQEHNCPATPDAHVEESRVPAQETVGYILIL